LFFIQLVQLFVAAVASFHVQKMARVKA